MEYRAKEFFEDLLEIQREVRVAQYVALHVPEAGGENWNSCTRYLEETHGRIQQATDALLEGIAERLKADQKALEERVEADRAAWQARQLPPVVPTVQVVESQEDVTRFVAEHNTEPQVVDESEDEGNDDPNDPCAYVPTDEDAVAPWGKPAGESPAPEATAAPKRKRGRPRKSHEGDRARPVMQVLSEKLGHAIEEAFIEAQAPTPAEEAHPMDRHFDRVAQAEAPAVEVDEQPERPEQSPDPFGDFGF